MPAATSEFSGRTVCRSCWYEGNEDVDDQGQVLAEGDVAGGVGGAVHVNRADQRPECLPGLSWYPSGRLPGGPATHLLFDRPGPGIDESFVCRQLGGVTSHSWNQSIERKVRPAGTLQLKTLVLPTGVHYLETSFLDPLNGRDEIGVT